MASNAEVKSKAPVADNQVREAKMSNAYKNFKEKK